MKRLVACLALAAAHEGEVGLRLSERLVGAAVGALQLLSLGGLALQRLVHFLQSGDTFEQIQIRPRLGDYGGCLEGELRFSRQFPLEKPRPQCPQDLRPVLDLRGTGPRGGECLAEQELSFGDAHALVLSVPLSWPEGISGQRRRGNWRTATGAWGAVWPVKGHCFCLPAYINGTPPWRHAR